MWRTFAAILFSSLLCACASAGIIARYAREATGGVPGVRTAIRLPIGLCPGGAEECGSDAAELFERLSLAPANTGRVTRLNSAGDADFPAFADQLTDGDEDFLQFRSKLVRLQPPGEVEGDSASLLEYEAFFPTHPTSVDFSEFIVEGISMTLDALTLTSPGSDQNGDGRWTDYAYRVTYTVMGYPLPKADCDHDGRSTLADWAYLLHHGSPTCLRGPDRPVQLGCDCGNVDANIVNEFDMDLRDFAIYQNAFSPP